MSHQGGFVRITATIVGVMLLGTAAAVAADESRRWSDTAELSFVATGGNTAASSFGLKNILVGSWGKSEIMVRASGIRVETEKGSRRAVELPGGGFTVVDPDSEVAAENYALSVRYDRKIRERFFWFAGTGWDRNEPAGIRGRYVAEVGAGNTWRDEEHLKFKTTYAATITKQNDVTPIPGAEDRFGGLRVAWDYLNRFGKSTTYTNVLIVDENLDQTSDWRVDMQNGLAVSISEKLALKVGLQLLYDNEPAVEQVDLFMADGTTATGETRLVPLDELDTIFTVSLVVSYE